MEEIGDDFRKMGEFLIENKIRTNPSFLDYFNMINEFNMETYLVFKKFDWNKLIELKKKRLKIEKNSMKLIKAYPELAFVFHCLMGVLDKMHHITEEFQF